MTTVDLYSACGRAAPLLDRAPFKTSRRGQFCSQRELVAQTDHAIEDWPVVILKKLVYNAIDAAEEAQTAPEIDIKVSTETGEISIADNEPGIPASVIKNQLPRRAAIDHEITLLTAGRKGTQATVFWPDSACSILAAAEARFLQIADDFGCISRRLRIRVEWNGLKRVNRDPSNLAWEEWRACDQTSAHWYDLAGLERFSAAHVSRDHGRDRAAREFISKLRGFSGSAKQKLVLDDSSLARAPLSSLFTEHGVRKLIPQDDVIEKHARWLIKEQLIAIISDAFDKEPAKGDLPADLRRQIEEFLEQNLELPWDEAVARIISGETALGAWKNTPRRVGPERGQLTWSLVPGPTA
jgi:hypothetical protein